ncbi:Mlp family lipoprotein [Borrelia coriaceae]|nr:Mlp family lipoprotein [Borrelia coriaceae]
MQIFIKLLVLCSTLFLYCCNSDKINDMSDKTIPIPHKLPIITYKGPSNLQTKTRKPPETKTDTLTAEITPPHTQPKPPEQDETKADTLTTEITPPHTQPKPPEQDETKADTLTIETTITNKPPETRVATLIDDEKQKFDVLINAFNKMIELKRLPDNELQESQNFLNWIRATDVKKQEELANAFTLAYDFLKDKTSQQSNNLTTTQFINNALTCCDTPEYNRNTTTRRIQTFFRNILYGTIKASNNNEERFQDLKTELLRRNNHVNFLLGIERFERKIRMQLKNDNNRTQVFNFLMNALTQDLTQDMNIYIRSDFSLSFFEFKGNGTVNPTNLEKLKSILDHIHTELNKCNGNETGQTNFGNRIKKYFLKASQDNTLYNDDIFNKFKTEILSDCQK